MGDEDERDNSKRDNEESMKERGRERRGKKERKKEISAKGKTHIVASLSLFYFNTGMG